MRPVARRYRSRGVELYIAVWLAIELVAALSVGYAPAWVQSVIVAAVAFRIFDVFQALMNLNIFDRLRIAGGRHYVTSLARTAILSVWNFFEVSICFGVIYSSHLAQLSRSHPLDPYYFSVVTQLTIGYGDVSPVGGTRFLAVTQGLLGFLIAVIVVSRIVAFLPATEPILGDD
jgi:hypothetical protein